MSKKQNTLPLTIDDVSYIIEIENSKTILKFVKRFNIPKPDIQGILKTFENHNILVDRNFKEQCTLEDAISKLESRYLPLKTLAAILNDPLLNVFLLQESIVDDSSSNSSNLTGELSSGD